MKRITYIIIATLLASALSSCSKSIVGRAEVRDLVLIYDGGTHRTIDWNKEKLAPYVATEPTATTQTEWLFDGFLFLEIFHDENRGYATGLRKQAVQKEQWEGLIDTYLTPGRDIAALNDAIADARKNIKGKFHRRKIVLSLPEPVLGQTDWGELDGKTMDFNNDEDRIKACKWYIDLLIEKVKAANLENIQLCGFYWLAEHATETQTFVKSIADYIHQLDLDFYWIPYFKADGYERWAEFGFDHAYLQPNHFFHDYIPDSRIDETCVLAKAANMSLEMEFDERALEQQGNWAARMTAYIDSYERNGIYKEKNLAYYQGNDTWYLLKYGTEQDQALYKRLSTIIAKRQREFYENND